MAHQINRLTALEVKNLQRKGRYSDGGGLYLQVTKTGGKSWLFRYRSGDTSDGQPRIREMGLGSIRDVSLADARQKAAECRTQKLLGTGPLESREAAFAEAARREAEHAELAKREAEQAAKAITFRTAATLVCRKRSAKWKNKKHAQQWTNTLAQYAYPLIGEIAVENVTKNMIADILNPIWLAKSETARRLRGRIEAVLDWTIANDYRSGENPARLAILEHLLVDAPPRSIKHFAALPYREIASFIAVLREQRGLAAKALQLLILTATRTNEALRASWKEFELDGAVWTIPGVRTKTKREYKIPLSTSTVALMRDLRETATDEIFIFSNRRGRPLSNMAMLKVLERLGRTDITVHGFRSSFRDWAAEETDYPGDLAEMALGHVVKNKVEAAYRRGDLLMKRRLLMEDWAMHCEGQKPLGQVTTFTPNGRAA